MKLSEMNFEDIKLGLEVISDIKTTGKITKIIPELRGNGVRYDTVYIDWDNGKQSIIFHMNSENVTVK